MQKVVFWTGPLSLAHVRTARIPDADKFVLIPGGCPPGGGDPSCQGSSYFSKLADQYFDGKRYLPKLLKSKGLDPLDTELYVGSFSAGHGAVKKWCMDPDDRALLKVVALADSTYCPWPNKVPQFAEGYVRACVDAVTRPHLFIATASSSEDPAGNTPAGDKCMLAIKAEVEKRTGLQFTEQTAWPAGIDPQPVKAYQLGNCLLVDYGPRLTHPQHATRLAPQVWSQVVTPWMSTTQQCITVAALPPSSTQGLGAWPVTLGGVPPGVAANCTMWGNVPVGQGAPPVVAKSPTFLVDTAGANDTLVKVLTFGAGGAAAYLLTTLLQRRVARP